MNIFSYFLFGFIVFSLVRLITAGYSRWHSITAITNYSQYLVNYGWYDRRQNYYKEMLNEMEVTAFLTFWRFGVDACVKPQFRKTLKPFFDTKQEIRFSP